MSTGQNYGASASNTTPNEQAAKVYRGSVKNTFPLDIDFGPLNDKSQFSVAAITFDALTDYLNKLHEEIAFTMNQAVTDPTSTWQEVCESLSEGGEIFDHIQAINETGTLLSIIGAMGISTLKNQLQQNPPAQ